MIRFKKITLVIKNSSWWKEKKYRKESAAYLASHRKQGWRFIKKEMVNNKFPNKDTRSFCTYYLKKRPRHKARSN